MRKKRKEKRPAGIFRHFTQHVEIHVKCRMLSAPTVYRYQDTNSRVFLPFSRHSVFFSHTPYSVFTSRLVLGSALIGRIECEKKAIRTGLVSNWITGGDIDISRSNVISCRVFQKRKPLSLLAFVIFLYWLLKICLFVARASYKTLLLSSSRVLFA